MPCGGGTTFKPGGGAGARREEAVARQLRGVGAVVAAAKAEAGAVEAVVTQQGCRILEGRVLDCFFWGP